MDMQLGRTVVLSHDFGHPLDRCRDKSLSITGFDARYLPSGHLVLGRRGSLLATAFDLERLVATGNAIPILEGVAMESIFANVHAAIAGNH